MAANQPSTDYGDQARAELQAFAERLGAMTADAARDPRMVRLRKRASERFGELGLPTSKNEAWKYTSLARLCRTAPELAAGADTHAELAERVRALADRVPAAATLVVVDGRYEPGLCRGVDTGLPSGVRVGGLTQMMQTEPALLQGHLGRIASLDDHPLVALNTGFLFDGACIWAGEDAAVDGPIHVVHVTGLGGRATAAHPRTLLVADRGARLAVLESHIGATAWDEAADAATPSFTNAVTEVRVAESASVAHHRLQLEGAATLHVGVTGVELLRDSTYASHVLSLGGRLARNESQVRLLGEGASVSLSGLSMARGEQHVDNHLRIDHAMPRGSSRQLFKGIVDGQATAVFSGQVHVAREAQRTDAQQLNRNLLLSAEATADTRPTLEILADDVKCSHGATVGQLDEEVLFYMRSRGIDAADARRHLTYAFAREVVEQIAEPTVRDFVDAMARSWLSFAPGEGGTK